MYFPGFKAISVKVVCDPGNFSDSYVAVNVISSVGLFGCYKVLGAVYSINVHAQIKRCCGFSLRNGNFRPPKGRQSLSLIRSR